MTLADLTRFLDAQAARSAGFDDALAEIREGRKRSHWIWYVFPQLRGLGSSPTTHLYGLADAQEAAAYLKNDTLRGRLLEITRAANGQLSIGVPLRTLMGSDIDAMKVVSSMTLFATMAARLEGEAGASPEIAAIRQEAEALLHTAQAQGYRPCERTRARLAADSAGTP